jgi:hypothetical protein
MSSILKARIPFFRRKTNGGTDGLATFYLGELPTYLPSINQTVMVVHTDVPTTSGLKTKLTNISTNTVPAFFQSVEQNTTQESVQQVDGFANFMILQYEDVSFSTSQFGGDCRGYIEYDVNPAIYSVLKPIESAVVVNESIPFDLNDGLISVTHTVTGNTYPTNFIRGMFVKRTDTNTIFANLLKSLNLPVADEEMKKYTRSQYGTLAATTGTTFDTIIDNTRYIWTPLAQNSLTTGSTTQTLVVHPTTGWTGEFYGTALQPVGSYDYTPTNKAALPIQNEVYLIFEIPNGAYGELIDGKSIKFDLPYYVGTTSNVVDARLGFYTYNTTTPIQLEAYGTYNKKNLTTRNLDRVLSEIDLSVKDIGIRPNLQNAAAYESNVVLLFSDEIKAPTGVNFNTWSAGYADLIDGTRVFNPTAQEKAVYDFNNDECIGFVALDKGFVVITHPKVVDSYFRNVFGGTVTKSGTASLFTANKNYDINGSPSTGTTKNFVKTEPSEMITTVDENSNVIWDSTQFVIDPTTGTTLYTLEAGAQYISYNTEKSLNIVCLASSDEFFRSTNDTAKELFSVQPSVDFANFKTEDQNLYPVTITQLGIHDAEGNLLAICKPTQPVKKYWYDVVSFNIKIRL